MPDSILARTRSAVPHLAQMLNNCAFIPREPLDLGSQRIAYSGDTGWFDDLPTQVAGSDLFISECTYHSYGFEYHLNYELLLERRKSFDCNRIVLTHLGKEMLPFRGACELETADDGFRLEL